MGYQRHEWLVGPARRSASLTRLAGGIAVIAGVFILLSMLLSSIFRMFPERGTGMARDLATGSTPFSALVNLFAFGLLIVALWIALRLVHHRPLAGLFGPGRPAMGQFARVCLALVPLYLVIGLLPTPEAFALEPNLPPAAWLALLPLAVPAVMIQVSAEELAFRGYLQSQLAARLAHPVVWIGLPSALFAMLHYNVALGSGPSWLMVAWAGLFGIAAADLTARAGTLGPAIALHLVNNVSALLIAAPRGAFDGLALYSYPFSLDESAALIAWLPVDALVLLCSWLAARLVLRR